MSGGTALMLVESLNAPRMREIAVETSSPCISRILRVVIQFINVLIASAVLNEIKFIMMK
jgi:hypothetical protein